MPHVHGFVNGLFPISNDFFRSQLYYLTFPIGVHNSLFNGHNINPNVGVRVQPILGRFSGQLTIAVITRGIPFPSLFINEPGTMPSYFPGRVFVTYNLRIRCHITNWLKPNQRRIKRPIRPSANVLWNLAKSVSYYFWNSNVLTNSQNRIPKPNTNDIQTPGS